MTPRDPEAAEFRAFVRAHHPDVGGDPAAFAAGLAARGRGPAASGRRATGSTDITFVRSRSLRRRLLRRLAQLRGRPTRTTPLR